MPQRTRHLLLWFLLGIVAGGGIFLGFYIPTLGPALKSRIVSALALRFNADVQLAALHVSVYPLPSVDGDGLVISPKDRLPDTPPMIQIRHFHAQTGFATIINWRELVDEVDLDGLQIHLPPRTAGHNIEVGSKSDKGATQLKFIIRKIVANRALIQIEPKPGKDPLIFPIESLVMTSVGPGQAMAFTAQLTNAKPPGAINTTGHFGPWQREDPRTTPISGDYTFKHADLSAFKGISGILSSTGKFNGVLQRILVEGNTDTPDFALKKGGATVHLTTHFNSIVDGTNGDTVLNPVDAKFGKSEFICTGGVVHHPGDPGKTVELDAHTRYARMEDILTLVVPGPPVIKGAAEFQSKIIIPPTHEPVADKLNLDGQFHLSSAVFTDPKTAQRLRTLSDRASGITSEDEKKGEGDANVASNLFARFKLNNATISLPTLSFEVPGSRIHLAGTYGIVSSAIDMKGTFAMHARLSQTQSGFKSLLLKPFDRYFEKDGAGFEVPIEIGGTREHPAIGVTAFHKTFTVH